MVDYYDDAVPGTFAELVLEMGSDMLQYARDTRAFHGSLSGIRTVFAEQSLTILRSVGFERLMVLMASDANAPSIRIEPREFCMSLQDAVFAAARQEVISSHGAAMVDLAFSLAEGCFVRDIKRLAYLVEATAPCSPAYLFSPDLVAKISAFALLVANGRLPGEDDEIWDFLGRAGEVFNHVHGHSGVDWNKLAEDDIDRPLLRRTTNSINGYRDLLASDMKRGLAFVRREVAVTELMPAVGGPNAA